MTFKYATATYKSYAGLGKLNPFQKKLILPIIENLEENGIEIRELALNNSSYEDKFIQFDTQLKNWLYVFTPDASYDLSGVPDMYEYLKECSKGFFIPPGIIGTVKIPHVYPRYVTKYHPKILMSGHIIKKTTQGDLIAVTKSDLIPLGNYNRRSNNKGSILPLKASVVPITLTKKRRKGHLKKYFSVCYYRTKHEIEVRL